MVTRKTQYGWMATGGLICLFALVLACKLRDGARAAAQGEAPPTDAKTAETKAETPKKEENSLVPLEAAGNPLPPIDEGVRPAGKELGLPPPAPPVPGDPLSPAGKKERLIPPPAGSPRLQATMPLPVPLGGPAPLTPTNYVPDPVAGAAGTDVSPPPPAIPGSPPVKAVEPLPAPSPVRVGPAGPVPPGPLAPPPAPSAPRPAGDPTWDRPATPLPPPPPQSEPAETHPQPGEPPLAPAPGPVQTYQVRTPETMRDLARRTLGAAERWTDIHKLNPLLKPETTLAAGTVVRLPGDACISGDETEPVKPLPAMHPKAGPTRPKVVLPLTGTYPANLDDKKTMTLPTAIREQLAGTDIVLISPGPDQCLWLTNQEHLERLAQRLEQSPAREIDVRVFKRLYYAQTEKATLGSEGRVAISERLAQFAGLHQEVILVGIDDHFELWDAARWRQYTQQKGGSRPTAGEQE